MDRQDENYIAKSLFGNWGRNSRSDTKLENTSRSSIAKSGWRSRSTESSAYSYNSEPWRRRSGISSTRKWQWSERRMNGDEDHDKKELSSNNDEDDVSETLSNLFGIINLGNTKSKIWSSRSSWRQNRNDSNEDNSSENSTSELNWRSRRSRETDSSGSWKTKYNADKIRKYEERNKTTTDKHESLSWRTHAVLRNDNEDDISDNASPIRYRSKFSDENQYKKSYGDVGRIGQKSSGRNIFRENSSHHNLSLRQILNLEPEEDPEKVILALVDKVEAFKKIIGGTLSFENVVLLLRVFDKICSSIFVEIRGKLIISIVNGQFLEKISHYLLLLAAQYFEDKNENLFFWENPENFWNNLLILYENIFKFMPATASEVLPKIVKATIISINNAQKYQNIELSTNVKVKLEKFEETLTSKIEQQNLLENNLEIQEPPNSFRLLSVYPTVKEITTREVPFIRPIITNGAYQSVEHYLDVQFRLLKEDFTASLRSGICTYLEKDENQKSEQQFDVRIYENVQFISPYVTYDRVASLLQYTNKVDKKSIEESSKRFIYGSLVCFTSNNFEEISFGTCIDNDKKFLRKGQIVVDIKEGHVDFNKNYTMVECTVFFEPYYQVLMALKTISETDFPFKDYIIDVTSDTKAPQYINKTTVARFMADRYNFIILSPETWPRYEQVGLNESQFKAFQSALTQEFCIIQGPPGTGKTYTTLRIVEFLIRNKFMLNYSGPILVICFTNHALDQFLEGILPFTNYVLRVGGQSKSEQMINYNLNNYRAILRKIVARSRKYSRIDNWIYDEDDYHPDESKYNFNDYIYIRNPQGREYHDQLREIEGYQKLLSDASSFNGVINIEIFREYNCIKKLSWFRGKTNKQIIEWLLKHDKLTDNTEDNEEISEEEEHEESDDEINLQINELYNDRKITDDTADIFSDLSFSHSENVILKPTDFLKYINKCKNKIMALDMDDENHKTLNLKYKEKIELYTEKMNYLSWRLKQCKAQKAVEETLPDMTVFPDLMNPDDRWKLYRHWLHLLRYKLCVQISAMDEELRSSYRAYQEVAQLRDLYIMRKMHIIGMTTTGAARHRKLLQTLECPIVIAEEAAEVLESHILVSLTKHCQHLILIGDHQQLRPNTAQYNLAKEYNLDISLFERMVQNGVHCQQLNIQHRMRPEIAKLIVPAIYPKVENSRTVETFPPVRGVMKSIFFINHSVYEDHVHNSTTHKNEYEAKYLIRLASYFIKQGYTAEQITILTTYKGQMFTLLEEKRGWPELSGVRITVVDNFQGEENKIILLSLVRSNRESNIGFLKTENRVCVALSRAKEGFFIIGNMDNLERSSSIWPKIKTALVDQDAIGESLTLQCQIHGWMTDIRTWEDFTEVPEGGCIIPCNTKLKCGHTCTLLCHPYDVDHEQYNCKEKCTKMCPRGHPCQDMCYEICIPCGILLKTSLPCGHIQSVPCSAKPEEYKCRATIEASFSCGHTGNKLCSEDSEMVKCLHPCDKLLDCGHTCKSVCHVSKDPEHLLYKCNEPCRKFKKGCSTNEHFCTLKCCEDCEPCTEPVQKRRSTCTHKVRVLCNEVIDGTICREKCRKTLPCGHHCPKLCFEECGNCLVMVTKTIESCGHSIKTECRNEVDQTMCEEQCSRLLYCGHPCRNKCSEPCS